MKWKSCLFQILPILSIFFFVACNAPIVEEINIGYIGPLSTRATGLGIAPSKAMELAVEQYNEERLETEPLVNFYVEDDQWEKKHAISAYEKLRKEHNIDILFISNSDGTVAVQDRILEDGVLAINPLNNDKLLSSLNKNTFEIAKSTEEANGLVGVRIIELGLKKVVIMHFPNDFMTRASIAVKDLLDDSGIENKLIEVEKGNTDFSKNLKKCMEENYDAYVFFGYKEFGFAMKQARVLGITAPFFGSTTLLNPDFYTNSEGTIIGTECTFFMPADGNYVLAHQFLQDYKSKFGSEPSSAWPPMQAYDAMNLVLGEFRNVNETKHKSENLGEWLRKKLLKVRYFQGVCGNLSITEDGSSRGIYFSLYRYDSEGVLIKVRR